MQELWILISFLLIFSYFFFFHFALIHSFDKEDKKWNEKLKTINLKMFKYCFIFYKRKEGKISIIPFIYALIVYLHIFCIILFCIIGFIAKNEALLIACVVLCFSQFSLFIFPNVYYSFKYSSQRAIEKEAKKKKKY